MQIGSSNDAEAVKAQYAGAGKLNTRLSFHEKYSTNRQGYGSWIVSHYEFPDGARVLELGCGTGSIWAGHEDLFAGCEEILLTVPRAGSG
ncbi:MAG: hypothetical protein IKR59_09600 [Lachnospiraceae bacterium]|nr:hypothetical protein [Lachnospiraceae bacterium]